MATFYVVHNVEQFFGEVLDNSLDLHIEIKCVEILCKNQSSPNILELELKLSSTELNFSPSLEEEKLQFNLPSSILIPPSTCNGALEVERPLFG